jgi:hypothetical protein
MLKMIPDICPFRIDNRVPGGIPVFSFVDHVMSEHAFKSKSKSNGGILASLVNIIAFPFYPAVLKRIEKVIKKCKYGFRIHFRSLGFRAVPD